jgi:hypothetical protein
MSATTESTPEFNATAAASGWFISTRAAALYLMIGCRA